MTEGNRGICISGEEEPRFTTLGEARERERVKEVNEVRPIIVIDQSEALLVTQRSSFVIDDPEWRLMPHFAYHMHGNFLRSRSLEKFIRDEGKSWLYSTSNG